MGARAGSGVMWGGGFSSKGNIGSSRPNTPGSAKAGNLKVGDRLVDKSGNISKVISVTNHGKTKVDITMQWEKTNFNGNGSVFGATVNKKYYLSSKKL